ncbi:hypothetical protein VTN02DRAFT_512 [Thermoascus thermophilus]
MSSPKKDLPSSSKHSGCKHPQMDSQLRRPPHIPHPAQRLHQPQRQRSPPLRGVLGPGRDRVRSQPTGQAQKPFGSRVGVRQYPRARSGARSSRPATASGPTWTRSSRRWESWPSRPSSSVGLAKSSERETKEEARRRAERTLRGSSTMREEAPLLFQKRRPSRGTVARQSIIVMISHSPTLPRALLDITLLTCTHLHLVRLVAPT